MQKSTLQPRYATIAAKTAFISLGLCIAAWGAASVIGMFSGIEAELIAAHAANFAYVMRGVFLVLFGLAVLPFIAMPALGLVSKAANAAITEISAQNTVKMLPQSTHTRISVEQPHVIIYKLPGETKAECQARFKRACDEIINRVVIYMPFQSRMIEMHFRDVKEPEMIIEPREKFGLDYIEFYDVTTESETAYYEDVKTVSDEWRKNRDAILLAHTKKFGASPSEVYRHNEVVFAALFAFIFFTLPSFLFAQPEQTFRAAFSPSFTSTVPEKNTSVDFEFEKITFSRLGDGKSTLIEILKNSPVNISSIKTGNMVAVWVGQKKTVAPARNVTASVGRASAIDSVSIEDRLRRIDEGGDELIRKGEGAARLVAETRTFRRLVALVLFLAVISQFIARTAFGEGRISADGAAIFGRDFYNYGAKFRFLSWLFAGLFVVSFAMQWFYFAYEYQDFFRGFWFFVSPEFGTNVLLFIILLPLSWLLSKWVPNPKVDSSVRAIHHRQFENRPGLGDGAN